MKKISKSLSRILQHRHFRAGALAVIALQFAVILGLVVCRGPCRLKKNVTVPVEAPKVAPPVVAPTPTPTVTPQKARPVKPRPKTAATPAKKPYSGLGSKSDEPVRQANAGEDVYATLRSHRSAIEGCYGYAVLGNARPSGTVTVKFEYGDDGVPQETRIASTTLHHEGVENCVLRKIQSIRFNPLGGGAIADVTYPITFRMKD